MITLNNVQLAGHLGADAKTFTFGKNGVKTIFSIAVNSGYGEYKKTNWINLVFFGKPALIVSELKKGDAVWVSGALETRSWVDNETQQKKYATEVVVENFHIIEGEAKKLEQEGYTKVEPQEGHSANVEPSQSNQDVGEQSLADKVVEELANPY